MKKAIMITVEIIFSIIAAIGFVGMLASIIYAEVSSLFIAIAVINGVITLVAFYVAMIVATIHEDYLSKEKG